MNLSNNDNDDNNLKEIGNGSSLVGLENKSKFIKQDLNSDKISDLTDQLKFYNNSESVNNNFNSSDPLDQAEEILSNSTQIGKNLTNINNSDNNDLNNV